MPFLVLLPAAISAVVLVQFLFEGSTGPRSRWIAIAVFASAAYLQFVSRIALAGLLLQIGLGLTLLIWRRYDSWGER